MQASRRRTWARIAPTLALVALAACARHAAAIRPTPPSVTVAGRALVRPTPWPRQDASDCAWNEARAAADPAWSRFVASAGGPWVARYDRATDRLALASGSGIPWLPGRGNTLSWRDVAPGDPPATRDAVLALIESRARAFMSEHADLFRVPPSVTVVLDRDASPSLDGGRIRQVRFRATKDGVPVAGAAVTFRVHSGNLVQFGTSHLGDALSVAPATPQLSSSDALGVVLRTLATIVPRSDTSPHGKRLAVSEIVEPPRLVVLPWPRANGATQPGMGRDYRLAWAVVLRLAVAPETWDAHVDAITGELLGLVDANLHACPEPPAPRARVVAGVQVGAAEEQPTVQRPLPFVLVTSGSTAPADLNGSFASDAARAADAALTGTFFHVACVSCDAPPQAHARNAASVGDLSFGFGGTEAVGNGRSTPAERNAYYHLNVIGQLARGHLDDADVGGFFNAGHVAIVNLDDTCNGFAAGRTTFFLRGNASCRNCAEVPDALYHEWGHSLDIATFADPMLTGFDFARSEGMADTVAFLATHDQRIAPYFYRGDSRGLRQADEALSDMGVMTVARVPADCGSGNGPQGGEPHCEGQVFLQAHWHLGELLRAKYGDAAGWHALERLFFLSLPLSHTYLPDQADSAYDAVVLVDDDDGNLGNGTPDGAEILAAFDHHGMASTAPRMDAPECTPPLAPTLAAALSIDPASGQPVAHLTWSAGGTDARYDLTRNEGLGTEAYVRIATLTPPTASFDDASLGSGVTYHYRIAAFDADGCRSDDSNRADTAVPASPRLDVVATLIDDAVGDADGALDRGETVALAVALANVGDVAVSSATATLSSSHPGVAITRSVAPLPDASPGATVATAPNAFEVTALRYVAPCGARIPFVLTIEAAEGCVALPFELVVSGASLTPIVTDDLDTDSGWRLDPDGTDDATGGAWVREPPRAKWYQLQPGSDHTTAGGACFVTGNTASDALEDLLEDDVDDGCTTVQGPVLPLGGRAGLELSYWRRFHAFANTAGDAFTASVSNDGGATWHVLESVVHAVFSWQQASFELDTVLGEPADRLVVRFTACDAAPDSFIEVLVDDLLIRERVEACGCSLTAPPPAIAGTLLATGRKDEDGAEYAWPASLLEAGQHYRLVRGDAPDRLDVFLTPDGYLGTSWDDRTAPGSLYFYSLRTADCLGGESGD